MGDPDGIAALKQLAETSRDFLKFLITEARSASDHVAPFTAADGGRWRLRLVAGGDLQVERAEP